MYEWHYVGQYGQLGPLSQEQMLELVDGRVIVADTYVWKTGMPDWVRAETVPEFRSLMAPPGPPPPPQKAQQAPELTPVTDYPVPVGPSIVYGGIISPYSRLLAGLLQILPGVGRLYLGYLAIGVLQLFVALCTCGILWIWSIIDGALILLGQPKFDGYGRVLRNW